MATGKSHSTNDSAKRHHPKYRMIAIDLDGTLLSPHSVVTERTKAAVHKALSAGFRVCFATGRNWTESKAALEAVGHQDLAVFVGGAMVIDTKLGVMVHRTAMHSNLAAEVCRFFENRGHTVLAMQDTLAAGVDYLLTADAVVDDSTDLWMRTCLAVVHRVPNLGSYSHEHTMRVGIVATPQETARIATELSQEFSDRLVCHDMALMAHGVNVLEVFDPAVNKWQGLLHVARKHGIEPSQIIAIGDDVNDLPMIRNAGLGVAMGNAKAEVQSQAKLVIGSNGDDGLAAVFGRAG